MKRKSNEFVTFLVRKSRRDGLKTQSRLKYQRAIGRYQSSYQRGGSIAQGLGLPLPYGFKPWMARKRQKGGSFRKEMVRNPVVYPWMTKRRKYKRRRKRA